MLKEFCLKICAQKYYGYKLLIFLVPGSCTTLASLPPPVFSFMSSVGGNCTSTTAVDASGRLWTESGCEARSSGVKYRKRLTPLQKKRFEEAVSILRGYPEIRTTMGCKNTMAKFALREPEGQKREWLICVPQDGEKWASPFAEIFSAME